MTNIWEIKVVNNLCNKYKISYIDVLLIFDYNI